MPPELESIQRKGPGITKTKISGFPALDEPIVFFALLVCFTIFVFVWFLIVKPTPSVRHVFVKQWKVPR